MGEAARVDSIEVLKDVKTALWKFQEAASSSLGDAEAEMHRVLMWLQTEQDSYWQHQIRKREELVMRCKEAVRMKKIFKDASGRQQSAIDEEKALKIAMRQLEEAQEKLKYVRKWARLLPKEIEMYKGSVQRFATTVQSQIPTAVGRLDKLAGSLEAYVSLQAGSLDAGVSGAGPGSSGASMGRGGAGFAGIPTEEITRLLAQAPPPEVRAGAPMVAEVRVSVPVISLEQRAPAMLPVTARRELSADAKVFVAKTTASGGSRYFVHHAEPASAHDSGWSIAPADAGAEPVWEAIRAADLLKDRPDLSDLLGLPVRFSVIIDSSGISEVLDAQNHPAWRRA
jgi:hypothetical protein